MRTILLLLFFCISSSVFANNPNEILIQYQGKYLNLQDAAKKRGIEITQYNQQLSYKFENRNLDDYYKGNTDSKGVARFSQIYPEVGKHTITIKKNETIKLSTINLEEKSLVTCTGSNKFKCNLDLQI